MKNTARSFNKRDSLRAMRTLLCMLLLAAAVWLLSVLLSALLILIPKSEPYTVYLRAGTVLAVSLLAALWPRNVIRRMDDFRPTWYSCLYVLIPAAWSILSFTGVVTFIYSNF